MRKKPRKVAATKILQLALYMDLIHFNAQIKKVLPEGVQL